ncbi:hypothetical protein PAT3040_04574 [Paenibacillus agaridevorans]|uniref:Uncharacterized protein n=1 Tax=Paenibacillus agaridevorans TaxID=171404 RepID=A0A2R5EXW6_9BACL|nr:hypothetical protein PAT3040_04574 [Paenibacillus agaridevorans]
MFTPHITSADCAACATGAGNAATDPNNNAADNVAVTTLYLTDVFKIVTPPLVSWMNNALFGAHNHCKLALAGQASSQVPKRRGPGMGAAHYPFLLRKN